MNLFKYGSIYDKYVSIYAKQPTYADVGSRAIFEYNGGMSAHCARAIILNTFQQMTIMSAGRWDKNKKHKNIKALTEQLFDPYSQERVHIFKMATFNFYLLEPIFRNYDFRILENCMDIQ